MNKVEAEKWEKVKQKAFLKIAVYTFTFTPVVMLVWYLENLLRSKPLTLDKFLDEHVAGAFFIGWIYSITMAVSYHFREKRYQQYKILNAGR